MVLQLEDLTPRQIVEELNRYIIGQEKAKKAVAIALRNRIRRQNLPEDLRDEVAPKNIIMIGPTGVGKTEIARRLSKLTGAPFIKVEATKYTEVGYVGRDVESMIRDLMMVGINMVKQEMKEQLRDKAETLAEEAILDILLPGSGSSTKTQGSALGKLFSTGTGSSPRTGTGSAGQVADQRTDGEASSQEPDNASDPKQETREKFRQRLRAGKLDEKEIEIDVTKSSGGPNIEIFSGANLEEIDLNLGNLSNLFGGRKKKKRVLVKQARELLIQEEMEKLVDQDQVAEIARTRVESMGIVFVDEIDKIAAKEGRSGTDVSREGVQRDILPIVEGAKINTKYGVVDTSHILFIAAGAFHISKPSDLIPELQGRFPIRVELEALTTEDFYSILTQPQNALTKQYMALLETEGVTLVFTEDALREISKIAAQVNSKTENIGARRLHTILELLLEDISFRAPEMSGERVTITDGDVRERLSGIVQDQDLSRYIL
ncbi:ATP-dependent protease ATPase subunit HslU [Spirochaeta lutea]|uniref:ATP-dependent protease ATPase subunit HslU n=1 Tax=Spirochaeta lutea TaxID=1480694 RepID=A0A098R0N2_9SPIO|nr:ATP-dependent protease ATPase subunit HslU [Spirochaeta lutea]KGE73519.1 ATP-dependent protease [Spirochaeta lutea]